MADFERLEDDLLRFCPTRKWQILSLTFPSTANTDFDIPHKLNANDPEGIGWIVLQAGQPVVIYKDISATRIPWARGVVRLRCTVPSAQVVLALVVGASVPLINPTAATATDNNASTFGTGGEVGQVSLSDTTSGGSGTGALGPGITFDNQDDGTKWSILADQDPLADSLGFYDVTNAVEVAKWYIAPSAGSGQQYALTPSEDGAATVGIGDHNDSDLVFDEGAFKNLYATTAIYERGRTIAQGEWAAVAYNAANFTASAGTWTVQSADVNTFRYMVIGKTLWVNFFLSSTSTSAGMGSELRIVVPGGSPANVDQSSTFRYFDNGTWGIGAARVSSGAAVIKLLKTDASNWSSSSANNTFVEGTIAFEIQ